MNLVVNFAAIGFRPYPELGEFVNIGLIAVEAKSRYLCYKLVSPQRTKRISACFPEIDLSIFKNGIRRIDSELSALSIETNLWADDAKQAGKNHPSQSDLFVEDGDIDLIPQSCLCSEFTLFSMERAGLVLPKIWMSASNNSTVATSSTGISPQSTTRRRNSHATFASCSTRIASIKCIGKHPGLETDAYHVGIPLAFTPRDVDVPEKAIKPLNLAQATPTKIYTHGDEWMAKVRRLKRVKCLPDEFLFVVKKGKDEEQQKAAEEICEGLEQLGATVVEYGDEKGILEFAKIEEQRELKLTS